jgi:hypothetical protein
MERENTIADRDSTGKGTSPLPRLTLTQRVLAALPTLRREGPEPATGQIPGATAPSQKPRRITADATHDEADDRGTSAADAHTDDAESSAGTTPAPIPATPPTRGQRWRESMRTPPPAGKTRVDPTDDMTNAELAEAIKRIDDRERLYALFAAALGAVFGVVDTIILFHGNPPAHHKNHLSSQLILIEGGARILLAGLTVGAAVIRRRSLVAFSLLFLGTSLGFPLALLFFGLGGWMLWKVFRYQKVLTARGVNTRGNRPTQRGAPTRGAPARGAGTTARRGSTGSRSTSSVPDRSLRGAAARGAAAGRARRSKKEPAPSGPPPSKRYTPPKPSPPRPPSP